MMTILIDSREKPRAIKQIEATFKAEGVTYYTSKLFVGDYQNPLKPTVIVDRKQNLLELCSNVTQDHERFRAELIRAQKAGIKLVILVEHGKGIEELEDVMFWQNPRSIIRKKVDGRWQNIKTKATTGQTLYSICSTLSRKYGCDFQFCDKTETGKRIIALLS